MTPRPCLKNINILSFNGGNGNEEVSVLSYIMRLATAICRTPNVLHEFLSGDKNLAAYNRLVGHLEDFKDPFNPTDVFDMIVGARDGAVNAFALVGGKKGGNDERCPMSLEDLREKWGSERKCFLNEFEGFTLESIKSSQSVAGAVLSEAKLCDSRSAEYKDSKISQVLKESLNASDSITNPLIVATPRVKKIFGEHAYINTALTLNTNVGKIPIEIQSYTDICAFMVHIVAKAATVVHAYLGKDETIYNELTAEILARLASLVTSIVSQS